MKKNPIQIFILSVAIPIVTGIISGIIAKQGMDYTSLVKPPLSPPGYLFPIVWTILYFLMGVSFFLIYRSYNYQKKKAMRLYWIQLFLNFWWSILFFTFHLRLLALLLLIVLIYVVIRMIMEFIKVNPLAGYLQIPYAIWLFFAAYLNLTIVFLNM